jgi:hypothetical protein
MTSIATYASRGRYMLWGMATAHMYHELTDDEGDYINDGLAIGGWVVATGTLIVPEGFATLVGWGGTKAMSAAGWTGRAVAPYVGAAVSTVVAPVAAGYVIGATVGTVIANEIWGEEGAQTALGFYSGGLLPGTEAPDLTDYQYIFQPTAPGGPTSLYDIAETAVDVTAVTVRRLWNSRPRFRRKSQDPLRKRKWWHVI